MDKKSKSQEGIGISFNNRISFDKEAIKQYLTKSLSYTEEYQV